MSMLYHSLLYHSLLYQRYHSHEGCACELTRCAAQIALISSQLGFACINMTFVADQFADATGCGHDTVVSRHLAVMYV